MQEFNLTTPLSVLLAVQAHCQDYTLGDHRSCEGALFLLRKVDNLI